MCHSLGGYRLVTLLAVACAVCYADTQVTSGTVSYGTGNSTATSTVTVPSGVGTVQTVTVTINSFTGSGPAGAGEFIGNFAWVLQDNLGHQFVMWADQTCDNTMRNNWSFTLSDAGTPIVAPATYDLNNAGTYAPTTNCGRTGSIPAPLNPFPPLATAPPRSAYATTIGSATFTSIFGNGANTNPQGTWTLYTFKQSSSQQSGSFTWTLTIKPQNLTVPTVVVSPSIASPILTSQTPTFTATVSSGGNPVTTGGSVTFTRDGGIAMGSAIALNGSGTATTSAAALPEGTHTITASYSGGGSFGPASGVLNNYVVNHPTQQTGNLFCNSGSITLDSGLSTPGTPYPSHIVVGGVTGTNLTGSVSAVTLQLLGATAVVEQGVELLLVDPAGHAFIPLQQSGAINTPANNLTFTLADSGSASVPNPWTTGTFSPTAIAPLTSFPAPAPGATAANAAPPEGSASFASSFNGDTPNGSWSLFAVTGAHGQGTASSFSGGWCLNVATSGNPASTTTVTSSQNPTLQSTNVTITATVKDAGTQAPQTTGSVTFKEGTTTLAGSVSLNPSGQASFTFSSAVEGDHFITAFYSGGTDAPSTSAPFDQRVNHPTTNPSPGVYCNTGSITLPNTGVAPFDALPYPSEITLPFIPGSVTGFTVSANGITVFPQDLEMLLVSPNGTPLQNLVMMANEGGNTQANNINLVFSDGGSAFPANLTSSGTFKPAVPSTNNVSFPSPAPTAANLVYPATVGTGTLANSFSTAFSSGFGGVWELFANTIAAQPNESISGGWCMNLTISPPVAAVTKAAVGTFSQGEQGVSYTISVKNNGPGSSGDTSGTNPVTVVDTLPTGLTPAATPGSGTNWTCGAVAQVITCANSNIVASGSTYPLLTLFANVANGATSPVSNHASVSGGGFAGVNSNTTSTTVNPAPVLSVSKTSSGTFTQGGTAQWNVTVSNIAPSSVTSGTTTLNDTLPSGYTIQSVVTGANWNCNTSTTNEAICFSTTAIAGGSSFQTITLNVNVPAASPVSVTNTAVAFGGGDLTHTDAGNGATGFSTVSVVQVPASITINAGATQSTAISTAFATPLAVTVKDANSVVINNSPVTFTANPGGGGQSGTFASNSLPAITVNTNSSGVATAGTFNANNKAGAYTVTVTDGSAPSQTFNLTNLAGSASTVAVSSGSGQSATVSTAFTNKLVALVKDSSGNPVSGVLVTFTAPVQTGASATFAGGVNTATTDASGLATSAVVSANSHTGGPYTVVASAPGAGTSANFALTNTAGTASTVAVSSGSLQSATISTAFTNKLVALVTDSGGNPVSGIVVTFAPPVQTGASVTFAGGVNTATTDGSGLATSATITANSHAGGPYNITASAPGAATPATFALTNTAGTAATIAVSSGSGQSAAISTAFTNPLVALVTDSGGNPVSGVVVTFTAPAQTGPSATFAGGVTTATTNGSGLATSAALSANNHAGGPYNVTASAPGAGTSANFALTNLAGGAGSIAVSSGSGQSATINTAFTNKLVALVTDSGGNPVNGAVVTFTAPVQTGASITFAGGVNTATTNASGLATSAVITANSHAGANYSVTASTPGAATPATFTLTNTAGTAATVAVSSGSGQSAAVLTAFSNPLVALVTDSGGNPVSGVTVTFTAPAQTGPSATFAGGVITATTNASGLATSAALSANSHAGASYSVTAGTPGATSATFTLTNTAGTAATVAVSSGSGQSATILTAFASPLVALVTDASGNPVSGVVVTFTAPVQTGPSATFGGGVITATTNSSGLATSALLTANSHAGANYSVVASAPGAGTSASFTLTNVAGTGGGSIAPFSGGGQSAQINQPFTNPLVALVTDAGGNPVQGVVVTFTAPPQASASGAFVGGLNTATTDAQGHATSALFIANSHVGGYTVIATTPAASGSASFTLTNLVGPVANVSVSSGSGQSAQVSTSFAASLVALVTDAGGNPVSGVTVTFTPVPVAGASATLANGGVATTDANGLASVAATANATIGSYTVTASAPGAATSATFNLSNTSGPAVVTNVTSTTANGTYGIGAVIPATVSFSQAVNVTGTPLLALNSGGTASYSSGSGTSTLTFTYTVAAGQATPHLDATSSAALTLNGGTILDASAAPAILTLPIGGTAGSLFTNKNIAIDTVSPTVVSYSVLWGTQSYNVIGSARNRLPWQITGIQVVFSKPITAGDLNSLTGLTTTGFSGLGTNTLTWTITPTPLGAFTTALLGTGPDALKDAEGNALSAGAGFTQNLRILWGDFNDDGTVNSSDSVLVNQARNQPYNQFADLDGDGTVATNDVRIVSQRNGTTLP